jgi:hypothetical protein
MADFVDRWRRYGQRDDQVRTAHSAANILPVLGTPFRSSRHADPPIELDLRQENAP